VLTPGEAAPVCGTCEGIGREGDLLVRTAQGQQRILAGSVSVC